MSTRVCPRVSADNFFEPDIIVTDEANDGEGQFTCDGVADQVQANLAIAEGAAGRDYPFVVAFKGDFNQSAPVVYPAWTILRGGKWTLEDGSDCNQFENENPAANDCMTILENIVMEGNKDEQTVGHNVYHRNATQPPSGSYGNIIFRNLHLVNAFDDGLHVDCQGSSGTYIDIDRVYQRFSWDYGYNLRYCADMWITSGHATASAGTGRGCMLYHCGPVQVEGMYFGQGLVVQSSVSVFTEDLWLDISNDMSGLQLTGSAGGQYWNTNIRYVGSDAFVGNPAVDVTSDGGTHSTDNFIVGLKFGRGTGVGTNRWNFGIAENASASGNTYKIIQADDVITAYADLQGTGQSLNFFQWTMQPGQAENWAHGVTVNGGVDTAVCAGCLPPAVNEVVFLGISGYSNAATAAGEAMEIQLDVEAGADNEPWNTHSLNAVNLVSTGVNYAIGDVLFWWVNSRDYAGLRAMTGGDSMEARVTYEVGAVGANTDADMRCATMMYV